MVSDSAAIVLFAIRSALKLGQQLRLAYVDNTKQRELVLPLPNFFSSPDVVSATNYFAGPGARHLAASTRLAALLHKQKQPGGLLSEAEQAELCAFHTELFNLDLARSGRLGRASAVAVFQLNNNAAVPVDHPARAKANTQLKELDRLCKATGAGPNLVNYWQKLCALGMP